MFQRKKLKGIINPQNVYGQKKETKNKITKKGIVITALIVIGIVGASFIVYLVP